MDLGVKEKETTTGTQGHSRGRLRTEESEKSMHLCKTWSEAAVWLFFPKAQMLEYLFDDLVILDEGYNSHPALAFGTR